jgi:hypothetical protein
MQIDGMSKKRGVAETGRWLMVDGLWSNKNRNNRTAMLPVLLYETMCYEQK